MPASTALAFVPSAFQFFQGIRQKQLAKNLKQDTYIPGALREAEARTRTRAGVTKLPGQDRAEEKIKSTTANTIAVTRRNAKDSTTVLEKTQQADAVSKAAVGDMNARVEGYKLKNEEKLNQVLSQKASYQKANKDQFDAAKSALEGASSQNFYNAATNAATAGIITGANKGSAAKGAIGTGVPPTTPAAAGTENTPPFLDDPTNVFYKALMQRYGVTPQNPIK